MSIATVDVLAPYDYQDRYCHIVIKSTPVILAKIIGLSVLIQFH